MPGEKEKSVHLERFPIVKEYKDSVDLSEMWELFFGIKNDVYKALEEAKLRRTYPENIS